MTSTFRRSSDDGSVSLTVRRAVGSTVRIRCSVRSDGDFHPGNVPPSVLDRRRRALVDHAWTMLDQRHGVDVVEVDGPGANDGAVGDVLATGANDVVLGCWAADCAPVVVIGAGDRFAVAHAGWKGIVGGVLDTVMMACGTAPLQIVLGPVIGPCCYEFSMRDAEAVAERVGLRPHEVMGRTVDGSPSLDLPTVLRAFADEHGVPLLRLGGCTGCEHPGFSHRVRRDAGRHLLGAWQEAA